MHNQLYHNIHHVKSLDGAYLRFYSYGGTENFYYIRIFYSKDLQ